MEAASWTVARLGDEPTFREAVRYRRRIGLDDSLSRLCHERAPPRTRLPITKTLLPQPGSVDRSKSTFRTQPSGDTRPTANKDVRRRPAPAPREPGRRSGRLLFDARV